MNIFTINSSIAVVKYKINFLHLFVEIADRYDIHSVWVPGHNAIPGNCIAGELTRSGMSIELSCEFSNLAIPKRT